MRLGSIYKCSWLQVVQVQMLGDRSRGQSGPGQHLLKPAAAAKIVELTVTFG